MIDIRNIRSAVCFIYVVKLHLGEWRARLTNRFRLVELAKLGPSLQNELTEELASVGKKSKKIRDVDFLFVDCQYFRLLKLSCRFR
jgi:hypothetical protein